MRSSMRVLVTGAGAEDARSPLWANVVVPLQSLGHEVWGMDAEHAERCDPVGGAAAMLAWLLSDVPPELIVAAGDPPRELAELTELTDFDVPVVRVTAEPAPAVSPADDVEPDLDVVWV